MIRVNTMKPEERSTRTLIGIILIGTAFVSWGKWVAFTLGVLFIASAWLGYCATCEAYEKFNKTNN